MTTENLDFIDQAIDAHLFRTAMWKLFEGLLPCAGCNDVAKVHFAFDAGMAVMFEVVTHIMINPNVRQGTQRADIIFDELEIPRKAIIGASQLKMAEKVAQIQAMLSPPGEAPKRYIIAEL